MALRAVESCQGADSVEVWANRAEGPEVEALRRIPGLTVHASQENLGFAEVVNGAAERAGEAALLFLTNDARLANGALTDLQDALCADQGLAAVMPLQHRDGDPGTIHHGGGAMEPARWASVILAGGEPRTALPERGVREVEWLDGAAVLYRPGVLKRQPMWTGYGFYWEDVDWGLQCRAAGLRLGVVDHAAAYHRLSPTAGRFQPWREYLLARNRLLCAERNCPIEHRQRVIRRILVSSFLLAVRSPHRVQQRMRLRAAVDFLRGRTGQAYDPESFR
ncbi:MAG: glycosyltransferase family 2 protein [Fimbriimonadaceae bacterium]|nr:glycosyltransferase family 2 protein [Fimbriimonadaceae bacterium]